MNECLKQIYLIKNDYNFMAKAKGHGAEAFENSRCKGWSCPGPHLKSRSSLFQPSVHLLEASSCMMMRRLELAADDDWSSPLLL